MDTMMVDLFGSGGASSVFHKFTKDYGELLNDLGSFWPQIFVEGTNRIDPHIIGIDQDDVELCLGESEGAQD